MKYFGSSIMLSAEFLIPRRYLIMDSSWASMPCLYGQNHPTVQRVSWKWQEPFMSLRVEFKPIFHRFISYFSFCLIFAHNEQFHSTGANANFIWPGLKVFRFVLEGDLTSQFEGWKVCQFSAYKQAPRISILPWPRILHYLIFCQESVKKVGYLAVLWNNIYTLGVSAE